MTNPPNPRLNREKKLEKKKKIISQGWECPKCGSVYAIWVASCSTCKNSNLKKGEIKASISYGFSSAPYMDVQLNNHTK
mgnify:CR=1 FL=1